MGKRCLADGIYWAPGTPSDCIPLPALNPTLIYTGPFGISFVLPFFVGEFVIVVGFVIFGYHSELQ